MYVPASIAPPTIRKAPEELTTIDPDADEGVSVYVTPCPSDPVVANCAVKLSDAAAVTEAETGAN
jgi:hypothetical protein